MRLPVGLNRVSLGALIALPFLLSMLSAEVFLDSGEIAQRPRGIVVDARFLGTNINSLPDLLGRPLAQLPREVVSAPVELQVLVALEALVADFAHESVGRHESLGREGYHFGFGIWSSWEVSFSFHGGLLLRRVVARVRCAHWGQYAPIDSITRRKTRLSGHIRHAN